MAKKFKQLCGLCMTNHHMTNDQIQGTFKVFTPTLDYNFTAICQGCERTIERMVARKRASTQVRNIKRNELKAESIKRRQEKLAQELKKLEGER